MALSTCSNCLEEIQDGEQTDKINRSQNDAEPEIPVADALSFIFDGNPLLSDRAGGISRFDNSNSILCPSCAKSLSEVYLPFKNFMGKCHTHSNIYSVINKIHSDDNDKERQNYPGIGNLPLTVKIEEGEYFGDVEFGAVDVDKPKTPPPPRAKRVYKPRKWRKFVRVEEKDPALKKPPNAFFLFKNEVRKDVLRETGIQVEYDLNRELGLRWRGMDKEAKSRYYEEAMRLYDAFRDRFPNGLPKPGEPIPPPPVVKKPKPPPGPPKPKRCCAIFGWERKTEWCSNCRNKKRCELSGPDDKPKKPRPSRAKIKVKDASPKKKKRSMKTQTLN